MKKVLGLLVGAMLIFAGAGFAGQGMKSCPKMGGMVMKCQGKCPLMVEGASFKVENTKTGVIITVEGKDKTVIKEIQESAAGCAKMCVAKQDVNAKVNPAVVLSKAEGNLQEQVICPVMGTKFKKKDAYAVYEYKGKKYYLCCRMCVVPFTTTPDKYIK